MSLFKTIKGVLAVLLILQAVAVHAQADSVAVQRAKWASRKIAKGVKLKHYWFDQSLFGANQNITLLEVKMGGNNLVDVVADPSVLKLTSRFGQEAKALAGVNGTFFNMKNGGSSYYVRVNGRSADSSWVVRKERNFRERCALVCHGNRLTIEAWDGSADWEKQIKGEDVMAGGPLLMLRGQVVQNDTVKFNTDRHPRTAVAVKGNTLWLITVDGRNNKAAGMSIPELSSFVKWLGADDAMNLDGGGSTTMWVTGFPDNGVVNHPSDNQKMMTSAKYKPGMDLDNLAPDMEKWDHGGERPVANVLLISRKR
ncbi:phosphodiester glycosidase family protein [Paraflavitalea pollutisoli]|uniref:phosphodiester glycosidase family protein n=1 Tax=Paraflavitalea pollutisoli TaxID=3034143 RepID=UPI0023EABEEB|nr:phosphodiester glycosidase family protein [Paraflavitalea sp. H1-2-19X]